MLSLTGTGCCAYESAVRRRGGMTSSSMATNIIRGLRDESSSSPMSSLSALADASWWTSGASKSSINVVDPARCLPANNSYHPSGCAWTCPEKDHSVDGLNRNCHDWTVDNWPSSIDDLLPTSETYKWMTIKRSRTKSGI